MADRVHPRHSTTDEENPNPNVNRGTFSVEQERPDSDSSPMLEKPPPPAGTYVVQLPKDQVFRVPSATAAASYERYNNRKPRRSDGLCCRNRSRCCRCFCCLIVFIITLIVLIGIAALIFYLVVDPKTPSYTVTNVSVQGFNLNQLPSQNLYPEFNVSVSADNPNKKIGIYYEPDSILTIYTSNVEMSNGSLPVFYQPTQNVTVFDVIMTGTVSLTSALSTTLQEEESSGQIPLVLYCHVPVKLKIGALKTWEFTVKTTCNIVVNSLSTNSSIISSSCSASVNIF